MNAILKVIEFCALFVLLLFLGSSQQKHHQNTKGAFLHGAVAESHSISVQLERNYGCHSRKPGGCQGTVTGF
jgi:hypothetical protein